jgi:hypothetical protein
MSCDLEPTELLGAHYQGNVMDVINDGWDMLIAFPPCTHLAVSGARHFEQKRKDGRQQEGIDLFMKMINAPIDKIAVENPIGIMSSLYKKPSQIIQPYQFGHEAQKSTCLWLKNLPLLTPTNIVGKGDFYITPSGKKMASWMCDPVGKDGKKLAYGSDEIKKVRNKTFQGIANAMASQWGNSSNEWRNECEARELLTWPIATRRKQLALVLEKRGLEATLKLKDEMERQWKLTRTKHQNLSLITQTNTQKPTQGELL